MYRGDGLVQRRRVVNSSCPDQDGSNEAGGHPDKVSGHNMDADSSSQNDLNSNPTIDEDSDKETRLTLMEEVLLLGLKDKEVCYHFPLPECTIICFLILVFYLIILKLFLV